MEQETNIVNLKNSVNIEGESQRDGPSLKVKSPWGSLFNFIEKPG